MYENADAARGDIHGIGIAPQGVWMGSNMKKGGVGAAYASRVEKCSVFRTAAASGRMVQETTDGFCQMRKLIGIGGFGHKLNGTLTIQGKNTHQGFGIHGITADS